MTQMQPGKQTPVIALYTPFLQGLYMGELVNQLRQLSAIKGYRLAIIRTGSFGTFSEPFLCDGVQGVIILRNAIAPALAATFLDKGVACVSVAYDYFPLKIPVIVSDHAQGTAMAFNYLPDHQTDSIVFAGDMSLYDVRKRFECYCDQHEKRRLPVREEHLINVGDALLSGGKQAARIFLERQLHASAIIFGSGLTGVGFIQHLKHLGRMPQPPPDFICFDALPQIPVFTPEMASIDQNLHLIAYRAFTVLDEQLNGEIPALLTLVPPKLIRVSDHPADRYDAFIATCTDLPEFYNPNYMKSLLSSLCDWADQTLESQLEQLLSIAPMFQKFMGFACLSRCFSDSRGQAWIKLADTFSRSDLTRYDLADRTGLCPASGFPPPPLQDVFLKHDTSVHLPLRVGGKLWGMLSFFGESASHTPASSYFGFAGHVENLVNLYEKDLEIHFLKKRLADPSTNPTDSPLFEPDPRATIEWNLEDNLTTWNSAALAKLGFASEVENEVYRNMSITDRIHQDDHESVRTAITECIANRTSIQFHARYRGKRNLYHDVIMHGRPLLGADQRVKSIAFNVGVADAGQ